MQFMTHQADLVWCFLDIKSDSQQNLKPDLDPARRTFSGKNNCEENECKDLDKIEFILPRSHLQGASSLLDPLRW